MSTTAQKTAEGAADLQKLARETAEQVGYRGDDEEAAIILAALERAVADMKQYALKLDEWNDELQAQLAAAREKISELESHLSDYEERGLD